MPGLALMLLTMMAGPTAAETIKELLRTKCVPYRFCRVHNTQEGPTARLPVDRREGGMELGSAFIEGSVV